SGPAAFSLRTIHSIHDFRRHSVNALACGRRAWEPGESCSLWIARPWSSTSLQWIHGAKSTNTPDDFVSQAETRFQRSGVPDDLLNGIAEDLSTGRGLAADTRGNWKRCAALSLDTSGAVM